MCRPDHARKPLRNGLACSRYYDFLISSRIWNGIPAWKNCIPLRGEKIELSLLMIFFACFPEYLGTQDQFLKFLLDLWAWSIDWTLLLIAYLLNFLISDAVISILRYIRRIFLLSWWKYWFTSHLWIKIYITLKFKRIDMHKEN